MTYAGSSYFYVIPELSFFVVLFIHFAIVSNRRNFPAKEMNPFIEGQVSISRNKFVCEGNSNQTLILLAINVRTWDDNFPHTNKAIWRVWR